MTSKRETAGDGVIIARSLDEPAAFGSIFDRHAPSILRYFARRVDSADAGNLMGEVFRIAFERRSKFDVECNDALPWLFGIAGNLLKRHFRSHDRRSRAMTALAEAAAKECVHDDDHHLLLARLARAMAELPASERDALLLHVLEDVKYEGIAAAQQVPVGTVRSRINRARRRLREALLQEK